MRQCVYCDDEVTSPNPDCDFCRSCYYAGRPLQTNMASVIDVLEIATGTEWFAQHTGGGCFWLTTTITDIPAPGPEGLPLTRILVVTEWPDVLSATATIADIEVPDENGYGGWFVGAEVDYWRGDDIHYWPDPDNEPGRHYGLHTEQLPMIVREAAVWLRSLPIEGANT
jgi:hypothetical protein